MGLFSKARQLTGTPSKQLLEHGLLGRGIITDVSQTSVSTGVDFDPSHVCVFTVEVSLDNTARYTATCRQSIRATILPQLLGGGATVAVRVDPRDHSQIALDLASEPPVITVSGQDGDANTGSAAQILQDGVPCRAVIIESLPLGRRNASGVDLYAFALTVLAEGRPPYQTKLGMPVPPEAVPLLYPGNNVPAKRLPDREDHYLVIDWAEALTQVEQSIAGR
jgi:hypothetical protein